MLSATKSCQFLILEELIYKEIKNQGESNQDNKRYI